MAKRILAVRSETVDSQPGRQKQLKQTFLDFGQPKFANVTCEKCGMLYSPGVEEKVHKKFCATATADFVTWKLAKESSILVDCGKDVGVVLEAELSDPRYKKICNVVDTALGFCQSASDGKDIRCFLFVKESRIVGYLETNGLTKDASLVKANDCSAVSSSNVTVGVLKIWVHPAERRKGIATKLIDAARAHLGYPTSISKSEIAFSPPTDLGRCFATNYFSSSEFMVYKL